MGKHLFSQTAEPISPRYHHHHVTFVSILVSASNDRWRPTAHPPFQVGGLLDRPPSGEAGRYESHLFSPWPQFRELRHHGERQRSQNLPKVLPLTSKLWSWGCILCLPDECLCLIFCFSLVPSLLHSSGSKSGASGSLSVFGGGGEQAAGDTEVKIFRHFSHFEVVSAVP